MSMDKDEEEIFMEERAKRVFVVKEDKTQEFMRAFAKPMISKIKYECCKTSAKGEITSRTTQSRGSRH